MKDAPSSNDISNEISALIKEVEEEVKNIDLQQHNLIREKTRCEGTLLWLKNLLENTPG